MNEVDTKEIMKDNKEHLYALSEIFNKTMTPEAYLELLRACIYDNDLTKDNKLFAYCQLQANRFMYPAVNTKEIRELLDVLYEEIYQGFLDDVRDLCVPIPRKDRNGNFVIVLTSQVLSLHHAPTKILLDRCNIISNVMSKNIFIINTNSVLPENGEFHWFNQLVGNQAKEFEEDEYLEWMGRKYGYFQCPREMPQANIIKEIVDIVRSERPYFILSIGDNNIVADICSSIVPVITICLGTSERGQTRTTFQVTSHRINDEDIEWVRKHNLEPSHFIEGVFTFSLQPQTSLLTREELGLPADRCVCLVVGYRLNQEVDDEFMKMVRKLAENNIYTAFMGDFDSFDDKINHDALLKEHIIKLGFRKDALAVYQCCDIYLNPKRLGGGTSAAGAMYRGLPVITVNYGDVAMAVGEDFVVDNYIDMIDRVLKLSSDNDYYKLMSQKAKERSAILTDSKGEFVRIIREMESRKEFW